VANKHKSFTGWTDADFAKWIAEREAQEAAVSQHVYSGPLVKKPVVGKRLLWVALKCFGILLGIVVLLYWLDGWRLHL
jgi:hypothetical protein